MLHICTNIPYRTMLLNLCQVFDGFWLFFSSPFPIFEPNFYPPGELLMKLMTVIAWVSLISCLSTVIEMDFRHNKNKYYTH